MQARHTLGCLAAVMLVWGTALAATSSSTPRPSPELRSGLEGIVAAGAPGAIALTRDASGAARCFRRELSSTASRRFARISRSASARSRSRSSLRPRSCWSHEGRLGLDDTVGRWLPRVPRARKMTVRQLLQHTSGVTDSQELLEPLLHDPNPGVHADADRACGNARTTSSSSLEAAGHTRMRTTCCSA